MSTNFLSCFHRHIESNTYLVEHDKMARELETNDIRCFQHCSKEWNILCFQVPVACPLCHQKVIDSPMRIPPFIIDSPFTSAEYNSCSIVIKPTFGSFLLDFNNGSNLHIGVTTSSGVVVEFDERGVTKGDNSWTQCLGINLWSNLETSVISEWDRVLDEIFRDWYWSKERYEESSNNCFDFVARILQRSDEIVEKYPCVLDRSSLCRDLIVPRTRKAGQYISMYRNIVQQGYVLQPAK